MARQKCATVGPFRGRFQRKARKPGPCQQCHREINPGEQYVEGDQLDENIWASRWGRICSTCAKLDELATTPSSHP